jgi:hypothetical protein
MAGTELFTSLYDEMGALKAVQKFISELPLAQCWPGNLDLDQQQPQQQTADIDNNPMNNKECGH